MNSIALDHLPSDWDQNIYSEYVKNKLDTSSMEYQIVLNKFQRTAMSSSLNPDAIYKVMNPYIYGRFQLRKLEYENTYHGISVRELFHTTGRSNVESIIRNNLDWRRVTRSKFGKGVSFSPSAGYANKECNKGVGPHRTAILCDVLVGSTQNGFYSTKITPGTTDTTVDYRGNVFVKYYDDEFCPKYLIEYIGSTPPRRNNHGITADLESIFNTLRLYR